MGGIFDIRILEKLFNIIWFENLRLSLPPSLYTLISAIDCYIARPEPEIENFKSALNGLLGGLYHFYEVAKARNAQKMNKIGL